MIFSKKIIAGVLSLCMAGAVVPAANVFSPAEAAAQTEEQPEVVVQGDFAYAKYSGHAELIGHTKIGEKLESEIKLPDKIDGVPLTVIKSGLFANRDEIVSVKLPDTITYIGENAFAGCTNLSSVNMPRDLEATGAYAFAGCKKLRSVSIPLGVKVIYEGVFASSGLTSIKIPDGVEEIANGAFTGCKDLTSVNIPASVTRIGNLAFLQCFNLSSITIENPDCSIYDSMFTITSYDSTGFEGSGYDLEKYLEDNDIKAFTGTIYGYEGSTAQEYADKYGYKFVDINDKCLGDVNQDGAVNALDASMVLTAYASNAVGKGYGLTDAQKSSADVNKDGTVDALDASKILEYYAYTATGGTGSLVDFLNK